MRRSSAFGHSAAASVVACGPHRFVVTSSSSSSSLPSSSSGSMLPPPSRRLVIVVVVIVISVVDRRGWLQRMRPRSRDTPWKAMARTSHSASRFAKARHSASRFARARHSASLIAKARHSGSRIAKARHSAKAGIQFRMRMCHWRSAWLFLEPSRSGLTLAKTTTSGGRTSITFEPYFEPAISAVSKQATPSPPPGTGVNSWASLAGPRRKSRVDITAVLKRHRQLP